MSDLTGFYRVLRTEEQPCCRESKRCGRRRSPKVRKQPVHCFLLILRSCSAADLGRLKATLPWMSSLHRLPCKTCTLLATTVPRRSTNVSSTPGIRSRRLGGKKMGKEDRIREPRDEGGQALLKVCSSAGPVVPRYPLSVYLSLFLWFYTSDRPVHRRER